MDWGSVAGGIASGLGSNGGPAMASGAAYGAPVDVSVGGLTVNKKPDLLPLIGAALLGAAVVWAIKA